VISRAPLLACIAAVVGFCLAAPVACTAAARSASFGRVVNLTPAGGAESAPQLAVGADGRVLATWIGADGVVTRFGSERGGFRPPQVVGHVALPGFGGLVAGVGPDGTAAVAWGVVSRTVHDGAMVSVAPPGGRFGPPRLVTGHDELVTLNGVGVDGGGRIVVSWRTPLVNRVDLGRLRYAIARRGHAFTPPRTLPEKIKSDGTAQLITTPTGDVIIAGDANTTSIHLLTPALAAFETIPVLSPTVTSAAIVAAAAGPGGVGAALYDTSAPNSLAAAVGAVRESPTGVWGPPMLIDATSPVVDTGPIVAFPGDGATVLSWGTAPTTSTGTSMVVGAPNVKVAIAESGGAFSAPVELAGHNLDRFAAPEIAAFGGDTAIAWPQRSRGQDLVRVAVRPPRSAFSLPRTLGRADRDTAISLAAGRSTAIAGWLSHGHVRVAVAISRGG
jgi:hypothetical protein